jgi:acetyl-CoA acetyltransferase
VTTCGVPELCDTGAEVAHPTTGVPVDRELGPVPEWPGLLFDQQAGVGPAGIDFAELYAACTIIEILVSEGLGLVPRGEGARWAADGRTTLGGQIPLSTSGGLISRGHPRPTSPPSTASWRPSTSCAARPATARWPAPNWG